MSYGLTRRLWFRCLCSHQLVILVVFLELHSTFTKRGLMTNIDYRFGGVLGEREADEATSFDVQSWRRNIRASSGSGKES